MKFKLVVLSTVALLQAAFAQNDFNKDGLIMWLDASDTASVIKNDEGLVSCWKDKSNNGNDAVSEGAERPKFVADGINGQPSIRFEGKESMSINELAEENGELTIYVVYRRPEELASKRRWQRILSSWNGETENDQESPSYFLDTHGKGHELAPEIAFNMYFKTFRGDLSIGKNMVNGRDRFAGEIAEILIFDTSYYVNEPIQAVKDYLKEKWNIIEDTTTNWTLRGPMSPMPERKTNKYPLIDQDNKGNWTPFEPMWDEFNAASFNDKKWFDFCPIWVGRAPGRFSPDNVHQANGALNVSMAMPEGLKPFTCYETDQYHTFTSGSVVSKELILYGYFEIRARPMKSNGSSAWWFAAKVENKETGEITWTEIDMFEIGGATKGKEKSYNMNMHVFESPNTTSHLNKGGDYHVPYNLADEYHTYGLYWGKDFIRYYIDGTLVRSVKNDHWHTPMMMFFDSETMIKWLGTPKKDQLPSTFTIDYVRAWKNADTVGEWKDTYVFPDTETRSVIVPEVQHWILNTK